MKKIQVVGAAIALFGGMAFAQLWTPKSDHGQVQFPWVVECTSSGDFDEADENDKCYKEMGGFWWGYLFGSDGTFDGPKDVGPRKCAGAPGQTEIGGPTTLVSKVEAYIGGEWVNFNGPDDPKCVGPDVTDRVSGASKIGDALQVKMTIADGWVSDPHYMEGAAGFGVTLVESESKSTPRDMTKWGDGFCLTYASDHENTKKGNSGTELKLRLGWNEGYETTPEAKDHLVKGYDGWYAIIPPSGGLDKKKTVDFRWTGPTSYDNKAGTPNEAGDFQQENYSSYDSWKGVVAGAPLKIEAATKEMTSIKIVWGGYDNASTITFKLYEFGWAGTCSGSSPIVAGNVHPASAVGFEMIGKTLSLNSTVGKPVAVQIINLQGAVVQSKTMSNGDKLSLQNLPTGVYMIRVPSQNYAVKQVVK